MDNILKGGDSLFFPPDYRTNMEGITHNWIEVRVSEVVLGFQKEGLVNYGQKYPWILGGEFQQRNILEPRGTKKHIQTS